MAFYKDCGCKVVRLATCRQVTSFVRRLATETIPTRKWKKNLHIYSYSFNWGNLNELSHLLARDVILNKDGLVVINKPFGIAKEEPIINDRKKIVEKRLNTSLVGERSFYLSQLLPLLARKLGYQNLEIVKIPERYTSGITILSTSKELSDHVKNCIKKGRDQGKFLDTYHLVCVGNPQPLSYEGKVGIEYEEDKLSGGVQPVLSRTWSKNSVKRGDILTVNVAHTTLCQGHFASLVEVMPSRTKSHFLRFYMAYMLSPILGDNLYGSRVQKLRSTPIAISPFSDRAKMPQRLEDPLLAKLDLERHDEPFIPAHIHLQRVTVPEFKGKGEPLIIEAPYPEVFEWTVKQLIRKGRPEMDRTEIEC